MALLEVNNITMRFGGLVAVDHFSFNVRRNEIISIIGPNGAGKSTVFNVINGLYRMNEGAIRFDGQTMNDKTPEDVIKAGIARTFQNIRLFQDLRVIENVMIGSHIKTHYNFFDALFRTKRFRRVDAEMAANAMRYLRLMGLEDKSDFYAGSLPYGDMRKVEIVRAMASGAKLLMLDEPAAGMNPQESAELVNLIKDIRDLGFTVLIIEHDMNVVMNVADRIYVLDYGKMIAKGLPAEIAHNPEVIKAYLGGQANASKD